MSRKKKILIVDDDQCIHLANKLLLKDKYDCISAYNGDEAKVILQAQSVDVVLLDMHMRFHEEGLLYLPQFLAIDADLDVIVVSNNTEIDLASRSIRAGASSYLIKEHSAEQLLITIESVLNKRELLNEKQHYTRDRQRGLQKNKIIGQSEAIIRLQKDIEKIRKTNANVIITAETGCGKELVAQHLGVVEGKPFVAVDSATITSSMAESILFGHEKGSFTGACGQSKGLFEEANGGTIYFDEISNMPMDIQSKILRVIQEKEITRIGSTKVIPLEFRVICASNKSLEDLVSKGQFKGDLYQRLNVINLKVPPLRERKEDIELLIEHFFSKNKSSSGDTKSFSPEAMQLLKEYKWPGNVRELSNLIANLCAMITDRNQIELEDLPEQIRTYSLIEKGLTRKPMSDDELSDYDDQFKDFFHYMKTLEGRALNRIYQTHERNISKMSKTLKMSRSHLYSKLYAHGIHQ